MEKWRIQDAKILTPYRVLEGMDLLVEGESIRDILPENTPLGEDWRALSAEGRYLSPGFVDIHTHGGGGSDFMDGTPQAILQAAEAHLHHGTTTLVPTTLSGDLQETLSFLKTFSLLKEKNPQTCNLAGVHLEGPYFSYAQRGAQDPDYLMNPVPSHYHAILEASPYILRWSFAPELEGTGPFIRELVSRGILPSIGHSDGQYQHMAAALECGATHVTHLFSCMSTITRERGFRRSGVLESALMLDEMTVELIADGCHVPLELLNMVYRLKGAGKTALVTDSMRAAGTSVKESVLGSLRNGQRVVIQEGVAKMPDGAAFAGSVATMDRLVCTAVKAGIPLCDAVRMATSTPARIMGLRGKGVLCPGNPADFILFDSDIQISGVWVKGRLRYGRGENFVCR